MAGTPLGLNAADIVGIAGFAAVVLGAVLLGAWQSARAESPRARIQRRLDAVMGAEQTVEAMDDEVRVIQRKRRGRSALARRLQGIHDRVEITGGKRGITLFYGLPLGAAVGAAVAVRMAGALPLWVLPVAVAGAGGLAMTLIYALFEKRFKIAFLDSFPDALELIIRAVRAGVPVSQAIHVAGQELNEPVRTEFRAMGDALRLGIDMAEVLGEAGRRIAIPDFNFFTVCVLLQRETGGQLAETLENLAAIIRTRRDMRLKAKALVAEGKAASQAIGAIPFLCLGILSFIGEDYVGVLYTTETGHTLLLIAGAMLVVGFTIIHNLSQLKE